MPVSGQELASLDFANLIGGPLNAIVEAQAKSAITTANFIKEVGFKEDGTVIPVEFKYNRKNDDGHDQDFTLKVPFLTMLPIPYITVNHAVVEFNAKITSINETEVSDSLKTDVQATARGRFWFVSGSVTSKTSYQKQTSASERAERTFDMHVRVEAHNQEMPAGTERILDLLEAAIKEKEEEIVNITFRVTKVDGTTLSVEGGDLDQLDGKSFDFPAGTTLTISKPNVDDNTFTVSAAPDPTIVGETISVPTTPTPSP